MKELDEDDKWTISEKFIRNIENFDRLRCRKGKKETIYLSITIKELCDLFGISRMTLNRWIKENRLNPNSLQSICDRYCFHIKGHV